MCIGNANYKIYNCLVENNLGFPSDPKLNFHHPMYEITITATEMLGILSKRFLLDEKFCYMIFCTTFSVH